MSKPKNALDNFFGYSERGSNIKTEVLAGLTTFIALAYILILNPLYLSDPYAIESYAHYDPVMHDKIYNGVFIGTCLGAFIGTFLCAVYARVPYAQAPGMGLNAFFAYTVCLGMGYTYHEALVIVFISGILFIVISAVGIREAIVKAIPDSVKAAITPGIGLFITILGLKSGGVVVANESTFVSLVDFTAWRGGGDMLGMMNAILCIIGLAVIGFLVAKNVKGAVVIGIVVTTIIGIPMGVTQIGEMNFNIAQSFKDFAEVSLFKLDFAGMFDTSNGGLGQTILTVVMLVISFSLVNMFDSIGTLLGAAKQAGMVDKEGNAIRMKEALMADAISTAAGALVGTSTVTTTVESASGIAAGGRTGLTSLTTALLFLASVVLAPIVSIIPAAATAPVLVYVGVLMLSNLKEVDFSDMTNAIPAFCTVVFMPFTYSIANGVAFGLILHCLLKALTGKFKEIKPLCLIVALIFLARYAFMAM
ncbi:MAG: NCS2 family permease [Oscillospiraceae bacterium]|nr:NCS2 family permease [Oscillospiraceae bacterium]